MIIRLCRFLEGVFYLLFLLGVVIWVLPGVLMYVGGVIVIAAWIFITLGGWVKIPDTWEGNAE